MKTAVYSGSFNPLHIGHLAIMKHLIEEADFDCVYLIVSPKNPLKEDISSASGQDRYRAAVEAVNRHFPTSKAPDCAEDMPPSARGCLNEVKEGVIGAAGTLEGCEDCAEDMPPSAKVSVDGIELKMPEPHYTIRTLDTLKEREPETSFTLVIGGDNLANIRDWKDYKRILLEYGVAVFPRTGFNTEALRADLLKENPSYKILLLNAEMVNISSTTIREAIASGQDVSAWLM